jgi:hypothetical protein
VVPIFKKGNPNYPFLEKVVYNQLLNYLESNKLLDNEQHGFRPGKSTITAAISFIESIIDSVDRKENVIGIFLDITKAFDSVSHDKLLNQLTTLNIKDKELNWFRSYLENRRQCVELHGNTHHQNCKFKYIQKFQSNFQMVKQGVPQGSILGPLLFICYLIGLPNVIPKGGGSVCLYADDANITVSGDNLDNMELFSFITLLSIKEFLGDRNLSLNISKSNFITFSTKQNRSKLQPNIFVDDSDLEQVDSSKFLGLILDHNLSWDNHVHHVVSKMSSGLFALRQMSRVCNLETLKAIYYSLINSHMSYGIVIYGATSKKFKQNFIKTKNST